jgi:hypothetical protein
LWEKHAIQVKDLQESLLVTSLDEISAAMQSVNESFHTNGHYEVVQTAFVVDLILLTGRNALDASPNHSVVIALTDLYREQLKRDREIDKRVDIFNKHRYGQ